MINAIKSQDLLDRFRGLFNKGSFDLESLKKGLLQGRESSRLR